MIENFVVYFEPFSYCITIVISQFSEYVTLIPRENIR